jgi:uncharacterized protein (DUF433 family)
MFPVGAPPALPLDIASPIRRDNDGTLRVGNSRVLLDLVVAAFEEGDSAEQIALRYSALTLPDVYAAISYYLQHPDGVREYIARRNATAADIAAKIQREHPSGAEIRARLLERKAQYR